jgi:hypothetical protein
MELPSHRYGRVCQNRPVLEARMHKLVWEFVANLMSTPVLTQRQLDRRLKEQCQGLVSPADRSRLQQALSNTVSSIENRMQESVRIALRVAPRYQVGSPGGSGKL